MAECARRDIDEPLEDKLYNIEYTTDGKECINSGEDEWSQFLSTKNRCARRTLVGGEIASAEENSDMKKSCCQGKLDDMATWECGTDWCPDSKKCKEFVTGYCSSSADGGKRMFGNWCATHPLLQTSEARTETLNQCIATANSDISFKMLDDPNCARACGTAIMNNEAQASGCRAGISKVCDNTPDDPRCMCIGDGYKYDTDLNKKFEDLNTKIQVSDPSLSAQVTDFPECNTKDSSFPDFSERFFTSATVPRSLTLCNMDLDDITVHGDLQIKNECKSTGADGAGDTQASNDGGVAPTTPTPPTNNNSTNDQSTSSVIDANKAYVHEGTTNHMTDNEIKALSNEDGTLQESHTTDTDENGNLTIREKTTYEKYINDPNDDSDDIQAAVGIGIFVLLIILGLWFIFKPKSSQPPMYYPPQRF